MYRSLDVGFGMAAHAIGTFRSSTPMLIPALGSLITSFLCQLVTDQGYTHAMSSIEDSEKSLAAVIGLALDNRRRSRSS